MPDRSTLDDAAVGHTGAANGVPASSGFCAATAPNGRAATGV
jgi:hypothetical protein